MQSEDVKGKEGERRRKTCEALAAENFPELRTDAKHMTGGDLSTPSSVAHRSGRTISGLDDLHSVTDHLNLMGFYLTFIKGLFNKN